MTSDLRSGDPVARQDIPAIVGQVVSMRYGWARVRWSEHFLQWIRTARLTKHQPQMKRTNAHER